MVSQTSILLLSLFTLLAVAAPFPQEGNQQFDLHNKSPSSMLAPSTPAPTATAAMAAPSTARDLSAAVAAEALKKNTKQPITGDDGTKLGMAAAMQGPGTATGALSCLPLAGSLGGLGAPGEPNIQRQNQRRTPLVPGLDLINKLPIIGSLADGLGGRDTSNLNKREAQIGGDLLGKLPLLSSLFNSGSKVKREIEEAEPLLSDAEKAAIAEETEVKKSMDRVARIKKLAAIVADVRGVTSRVKRRGFSKSIIDSAIAKVDNQLDSAALEDTERTVRPENTSFPPGMPVKTPQGALDKRADDPEEELYAEYAQEEVHEDVYPVAHPHEENDTKDNRILMKRTRSSSASRWTSRALSRRRISSRMPLS
ncbi:hypothetical protein HOY82DRAFT_588530 [Tuber indicum]|nr:hypothetical protein HOY82DRAFT_588530 [Tuber indicum]